MIKRLALIAAAAIIVLVSAIDPTAAKGSSGHHGEKSTVSKETGHASGRPKSSAKTSSTSKQKIESNKAITSKSSKAKATADVPRDKNGRIHRSGAAKHDFMKQSGYPKGRPGYVVDHVIPLKKGGCDCASNMQWQTALAAKAKDKWE